MRLWLFDFDGTISAKTADRTATRLDPACESMLLRLSERTSEQVAIVSNRSIDDMVERISIPGAVTGGCDGIEWQLPSGARIGPFLDYEDALKHVRAKIVSELYEIIAGQGVEIEDRLWSIAIHPHISTKTAWQKITKSVSLWAARHGLTYCTKPDEMDVRMIRGFNRSVAVSYLSRIFNIDSRIDSVIYAGHGKNDAAALWWTMFFGGIAIVVGKAQHLPGALYAKSQSDLVCLVEKLSLES